MKVTNRIIAYGCSWTTGQELLDHVHMGMSFNECNDIKAMYIKNGKTLENMKMFNDHYDIENPINVERNQKASWVGQLASMMDKPLINKAIGGSSLDYAYFTIFNDYRSGVILPTDLVLVGLTSIFRTILFRNHFNAEGVSSLQLGNLDGTNDRSLIELFNDDFVVFQYFKTLHSLYTLSTQFTIRIQPMVKDINPFGEHFYDLKLYHTREYAQSIWNQIKEVLILPNEYLKDQPANQRGTIFKRCGFLHQPIESHTELATKIFKQVEF